MVAPLRRWVWPPVPARVADAFDQLRLRSLEDQVPILYVVMLLVVPLTMSVAFAESSPLLRWFVPSTIVVLCAVRLRTWWRRRADAVAEPDARGVIRRAILIGVGIALLCSLWTVLGWLAAPPSARSYFPMFMVIGTLSAAFCMSTVRGFAIGLLAAGLVPTSTALVLAGDRLDRVAALIVAIAATFLIRVVVQRHRQLVALLELQAEARRLAETDPLTGLANRRALLRRLNDALAGGREAAVMLIDLDGFKEVNDRHGHAAGDALLCAVADRLKAAADGDACVGRLGGDEFAVVTQGLREAGVSRLADRLLARMIEPVPLDRSRLRVGASLGYAVAAAGDDANVLLARADARLYAVKTKRTAERRAQAREAAS